MTPRPIVHPDAEAEFLDAIRFFESQVPGRGSDFDAAVARAVDDAASAPSAWPPFPGWERPPVVRSRKVDGFPSRVLYLMRHAELVIIAVAHQARRPGYWSHRMPR